MRADIYIYTYMYLYHGNNISSVKARDTKFSPWFIFVRHETRLGRMNIILSNEDQFSDSCTYLKFVFFACR
jgi:hypothetical protein